MIGGCRWITEDVSTEQNGRQPPPGRFHDTTPLEVARAIINVSEQSKLATIECAICSAWLAGGFSAGRAGRAGARLDHDRRVTLAEHRAPESMPTRALVSSYGSPTSMDTASNPLPSAIRQRSARRSASWVTGRSSI